MTTLTNDNSPWWVWMLAIVFLVWIGSMLGSAFQHEFLCDPICIEQGYDTARATVFVTDACQCTKDGEVWP